jgi:hypothetical protein
VTIIEIKTSANGPDSIAKIPSEYIEQMSNYYEVITKIFQGYFVSAYFLFTENASFLPFSPERNQNRLFPNSSKTGVLEECPTQRRGVYSDAHEFRPEPTYQKPVSGEGRVGEKSNENL